MKRLFGFSCLFYLILLCPSLSLTQIPRTLSYQGILTDTAGTPKPDGEYMLTFRLYDAKTDGSVLWTEQKTIPVERGLFSTHLGDAVPFGASIKFDKAYWLSVQVSAEPELAPRIALSATAYSLNAPQADSARISGTVANNSITSAKIAPGTIQLSHLAQNGAANGHVLKWSGSAWTTAADEVGTGGTAGGWTDSGARVNLAAAADTVSINASGMHLGKLNLNGDIGLNGESSLFFGTTNTFLGATPGENLMLRANNDLKLYTGGSLTALATDNINFGHLGEASWVKMDNATKRVGIGLGAADAIDDRLHVKNDLASGCWLRIEGAHPTSWGQTGLRIKTPQNSWHLRMDLSTNANFPDGALSLYSSGNSFETMTWLKDGKVGVGTKAPIRKLHVNGSAEIEDTLYAGAINATTLVNGPGVVHVRRATMTLPGSYAPIDSLTVNAPGPGYVVLFFSGTLNTDHTFGDRTYVRMSITSGRDGSGNLGKVEWQVDVTMPSNYLFIPMALQGVAQVSSKGSYEFFAGGHSAETVYTPDRVTASNISFTALFIPAAYGTVESAPAGDPPAPVDVPVRSQEPGKIDKSLEGEVNALKLELQVLKNEVASHAK